MCECEFLTNARAVAFEISLATQKWLNALCLMTARGEPQMVFAVSDDWERDHPFCLSFFPPTAVVFHVNIINVFLPRYLN